DAGVVSGITGLSYLYQRNGPLFEPPLFYLTGADVWVNSPGDCDGTIDFGRVIVPQCLECHATSFKLQGDRRVARYSSDYVLGMSCDKCHGAGRRHVEYHSTHPGEAPGKYILNPARFARDRKLDNCALCHSGDREPTKPSCSYRPGDRLADFFLPESDWDEPVPHVHGHQLGLLRRRPRFRASPPLPGCTCPDV